MSLLYVLLICIWNSILFFNKNLGINVILFMIPLIGLLLYILETNKKIKNKYGLLWFIPIILLSFSYLIYDNHFFKLMNICIIILCFLLMYIYTMEPTYKINEVFRQVISLLFEPFNCIGNVYRLVQGRLTKTFKISENRKRKLKSIFIILPVVFIVLVLLSSADRIFHDIFSNFFALFDNFSFDNLFYRILGILILFTYLGATINYLLFQYTDKKIEQKETWKIDNYTIKLLLTVLNIIYIVFDFIQIRSLLLHQVSMNISYAEYAREGFFQLMFISLLNLIILLISKCNKEKEKGNYTKIMSILMVLLTLVIIISSFFRMYMYESTYGYTLLRLLVYITLITEVILLIPTIIYILNPKVKIIKYYMVIMITVYVIVSLSPVDYIIARRNINRYYETNKIDIDYLKNGSTDNIPLLIELHNHVEEELLQEELEDYFTYMYDQRKRNGFQEYNISKEQAIKQIEKNKLN